MLHWLLPCQLLFLVVKGNDLPTLEQINRALEQPEDNRLVEPGVPLEVKPEIPAPVEKLPEAQILYATPTIEDTELLVLLQGKIEGAPEKQVETSFVKRKPAKNTTIWTTVTPPTACSTDGCCPENVTTSFVTATVTSEDLFVYTVTETIDVTVFRGETVLETLLTTTTETLVLTSTLKRQATVTTTSFLTTSVAISRLFIKTIRISTPAIRTIFRNTSVTSTRFTTVVNTIITTEFDSGPGTITDTSFVDTSFATDFLSFTQTVFNPLTVVDVTVFSFSRSTRTVVFPGFVVSTILVPIAISIIPDPVTFTTVETLSTTTLISATIFTTTASNIVDTQYVLTTQTYSRIF